MYRCKTDQKVYDIAGVKVGGQPGVYPTLLCGTIFYKGQKIVSDPKRGIFDKEKAEKLILSQESLSSTTKNPSITHIYASTNAAMERYINFVSSTSNAPFIIDSSDVVARVYGIQYAEEIGLIDRVVYNSINMSITPQEEEALLQSHIDASILLSYNIKDPSVSGKISMLKNGGSALSRGLFDIAESCKIKKRLIDTAVPALGAGAGDAVRATYAIKSIFGEPVGCGIHNAVSSWTWLQKTQEKEIRKSCDTTTAALEIFCGADFVLYGPIEYAPYVFPKAAMADCFVAEAAKSLGTTPIDEHPFFALL